MPEYLAPGVYVEETSFRSKSIEGVSTSTTGFVGLTRKGPVGLAPELVTSYPDFQRMYGGFDDLATGLNYVAHGVKAFFDNGGGRLYVSRVFLPGATDGTAASAALLTDGGGAARARFVARFPGAAGNGAILINPRFASATVASLDRAVQGSILRVGGENAARPASLTGGRSPFTLAVDGRLALTVGGTARQISLHGQPVEVFGATPVPDPLVFDATNDVLSLQVNGQTQTVTFPRVSLTRSQYMDVINQALDGAYARLSTAADDVNAANANRLVIGSDKWGKSGAVAVNASSAGAALGFNADASFSGASNVANTLNDSRNVTAAELNDLLTQAGAGVMATKDADGRLVLTTTAAGATATLALPSADPTSEWAALGFAQDASATGTAGTPLQYYVKSGTQWRRDTSDGLPASTLNLGGRAPTDPAADGGADLLTITLVARDADDNQKLFEDLGLDPAHPRFVGTILSTTPARRSDALENLFGLELTGTVSGFDLRAGLLPTGQARLVTLAGGNDGLEPTQAAFEAALSLFEAIEDISIVAAPGHTTFDDRLGIQGALITHAEQRRSYRIAVLDTSQGLTITEARTERSRFDSSYAALYHPWVVVSNPLARPGNDSIAKEITLPPSSFVCGIYARNDVQRGVFKAPANEVVRGALRYETDINFAQQEVLNPLGVNCLRYFPGRGNRVWGARTASSDPEFKYVSVRRYFNFVERSIDAGTQWAVFEPNGERLWTNIRETINSFLFNELSSGALLGSSPKEAFFVRCDRSTMDQNDLDNGRLVCLIGLAVVKPAEFVIFRIGQKTADART